MPMTTSRGQPKQSELPDTIKRSDAKAQRTFAKAHDSAAEQYGEGQRAYRVAYGALRGTHKKVGDHWEPKGPVRGADPNASRQQLYDVAKRMDISGRSGMNKQELVQAIQKADRRRTARARS